MILTINGGSSSIKFAVYSAATPPNPIFTGQIERIGLPGTKLTATKLTATNTPPDTQPIAAATFERAAENLITYLRQRLGSSNIAAIAHRVVHGGPHLLTHQPITSEVVAELRRTIPLDLTHLPREISLIEAFAKAFPNIPQIACFDTAFHRDLPRTAQLLPIPLKYFNQGIRRYGFHGLSYTYLMMKLKELAGPEVAGGRIILAHLGSGASMAAVHHGKPIDTTMSFTPTAGLVMATRPGDLDPGLLTYLMRQEKLSPDQMDVFLSTKCGLQGLSETTSDMRDLTERRATDPRAADAIEVFCRQAKKFLGALYATLGGLDTLIFSAGIGEHSPETRAGICQGLESLGLHLDPARNAANKEIISTDNSPVTIRVITTNEELILAQTANSFLTFNKS